MILYILNQPRSQALQQCLDLMQDVDSLLFLGDAVMLMCSIVDVDDRSIYVLSDDVQARALMAHKPQWVEEINYADFVQMTLEHQQVVRWSAS